MITLLKILPDKWEQAKGYLRLDLEALEAAINQRWSVTFGPDNQLQPSTIPGDYTIPTRYIANTGPDSAPMWDQVNLTNGVVGILPFENGGSNNSIDFAAGSIIFSDGTKFVEDNSNLFWDDTTNRLGIGTTAPGAQLEVRNSVSDPIIQLRPNAAGRTYQWSANDGAGHFRWGRSDLGSVYIFFSPGSTFGRFGYVDDVSAGPFGMIGANASDFYIYTSEGGTSKNLIFGKRITDLVELNNNYEFWGSTNKGNIGLGFNSFPTGRYVMYFGDGTAPGSLSGLNTAAIYAEDVGGTVKMFGKTEADVTGELAMNAAALTTGSVLFAGSTGLITQDNSNLFWDDTNNLLGIGTASPGAGVHIIKTFSADQAVGMYADIFHNTATAGTVYGGRYDATCSHSSGTMNNTIGLINSARYAGTGTALATSLQGMQCFICLDDVASPQGTITTATGCALTAIGNFATGTPVVTISQARGLSIGDIGSGNGSNGLTVSNSCAMSIAGSQTAATNTAVINISNTTSVPFAPTGTWSIFNASTRDNHFAGPLSMGGTTLAGSGTNYIQFANGTVVGTTAADTSAVYTADTAAGDSNLFATNEQDYVSQLTGLDIAKTADESVANNTPQNDDHLLVNLPASSRYAFKFYLFATSPATAGLLLQLDGTAGVSTLKANINIYDSTGALVKFGRITAFNSSQGVDFTGDAYAVIEGVIEVSTAGTFRLEWAQNTTDGGNATILQEDSYLTLRRLNA